MGGPPCSRLPRRRLGRGGRRAPHRLGGAQLEGGRQGHGPVQLRRRPGPLGPRRFHAGGQPAHLGLRVELRRVGRRDGGQGEPAHAEAGAPELGGGGHQRPVQLDRLPDAGLAQRGSDDPGRQGARVGRQRRSRQATRCSTCSTAAARRSASCRRPRRSSCSTTSASRRSSTARRRTTASGPTSTPRTSPSGGASARTSAPWSAPSPRSCSSTRGARRWAPRCSPASGRGRS